MKIITHKSLKFHVLFWAVFVIYELSFLYYYVGAPLSPTNYIGHYFLNICFFYLNAKALTIVTSSGRKYELARSPSDIKTGKKLRFYFLVPFLFIAELITYLFFKSILLYFFDMLHIVHDKDATLRAFIIESTYRFIYFILLSTAYWLALTTTQNRKQIADLENLRLINELDKQILEKTLLTTENAYLKSQINPHFLLNTLNFLYNSVSKLSEEIAESVLLLSDIMRYALTNVGQDGKVLLEMELENIQNFIKLNQARFNKRLNVDMQIEGDPSGLRIIPLILITFIENIFKYGDLLTEEHPVQINVVIQANNLTFTTYNLKRKNVQRYASHGIGIENVKNRLAMYYKYELIIEDSENQYKSTLKLEL